MDKGKNETFIKLLVYQVHGTFYSPSLLLGSALSHTVWKVAGCFEYIPCSCTCTCTCMDKRVSQVSSMILCVQVQESTISDPFTTLNRCPQCCHNPPVNPIVTDGKTSLDSHIFMLYSSCCIVKHKILLLDISHVHTIVYTHDSC